MSHCDMASVFERLDVGSIAYHEPLSRHTTWEIGGPADALIKPGSIEQLRTAMRAIQANGCRWTVIGRGSNLLVRDGGFRGVVIKMGDSFADHRIEGHRVFALAGESFASLAYATIRHGLSGLEFATMIPGTVGGAVMMNAGAHQGEVKDVLVSAEIIDEAGDITVYDPGRLQFSYRTSALKDQPLLAVSATFELKPGNVGEMRERVLAWKQRRQATQPLSMPNCGSVFRNPPGMHAGALIERAGLKGFTLGRAQISAMHGNFIVNLGGAKAADVLALIQLARDTVEREFAITLIPEVRIVGDDEPRG